MIVTLKDGNEVVLGVDADPIVDPKWGEICLKHLGMDDNGLKLGGDLPNLWEMEGEKLIGPELYDDDHQYEVVKIDYENGLIWLIQI